MRQSLHIILANRWWTYDPAVGWHGVYHWFNVVEGGVWCLLGLYVARRFLLNQRSLWEVAYAVAFFTFGISDFIEAQQLDTWMLLFKAINLLVLILLRWHVLKRHYPDTRWI